MSGLPQRRPRCDGVLESRDLSRATLRRAAVWQVTASHRAAAPSTSAAVVAKRAVSSAANCASRRRAQRHNGARLRDLDAIGRSCVPAALRRLGSTARVVVRPSRSPRRHGRALRSCRRARGQDKGSRDRPERGAVPARVTATPSSSAARKPAAAHRARHARAARVVGEERSGCKAESPAREERPSRTSDDVARDHASIDKLPRARGLPTALRAPAWHSGVGRREDGGGRAGIHAASDVGPEAGEARSPQREIAARVSGSRARQPGGGPSSPLNGASSGATRERARRPRGRAVEDLSATAGGQAGDAREPGVPCPGAELHPQAEPRRPASFDRSAARNSVPAYR